MASNRPAFTRRTPSPCVCGFLLTEMNVDRFADAGIAEWEEALDRWFEMHPEAEPLYPQSAAASERVGLLSLLMRDELMAKRRWEHVTGRELIEWDCDGRQGAVDLRCTSAPAVSVEVTLSVAETVGAFAEIRQRS